MKSLVNGFSSTSAAAATSTEGAFVFEDPSLLPHIFANLNKLRKNRQFCDVVLQVSKGQETHEVCAHKAVLASASPYLLDLFARETLAASTQVKLGLGFESPALDALIEYCYTGKLEVPPEQVKQVFITANKLKMYPAAKKCGDFLVANLNPTNCIAIRSLQSLNADPELTVKVDSYIKQNFESLLQSKEFLALKTLRVEVVQDTSEHKSSINPKRLCGLILDWLRHIHGPVSDMAALCSRVHLLYMTVDNGLRDCNEIASGDKKDTELVQDYKKLTRRGGASGTYPAVSRHFLYSKSDSQSSLSSLSDIEENEWKVVAVTATGDHKVVGLLVADGRLMAISVSERLDTSSSSTQISNPTGNNYTPIPPMSSPRCSVGTAQLMGKLLVCGGYDRGECLKTVEMYDFVTNEWTMMSPMKVPRGRFDITVVDDKVYAIGGSDGTTELSSAEVYDAHSQQWSNLPSSPVIRSNAGVCSLANKIYVIGGWNGQRGLTRCDIFDPDSQSWTNIASLKVGRNQPGVAALNGQLYAVGGCEAWNCLNSVEKFDPATNTWVFVAPMSTPRRGCGAVAYDGKLYVIGGHDGVYALHSTEIYDPTTNTWSAGPSLTSCRANVGVALVENRIFAVGGFNGKAFLNTIEYLDPELNEWTMFVPERANPATYCNGEKKHLPNTVQEPSLDQRQNGESLNGDLHDDIDKKGIEFETPNLEPEQDEKKKPNIGDVPTVNITEPLS